MAERFNATFASLRESLSDRAASAAITVAIAGSLAASAPAAAETLWPNTFTARLEALALLQSLNADLLSHDSATETLRRWCSDHQLGPAEMITAERIHGLDKPPDPAVLSALGVSPGETVRYRRVRLACGARVLSEADNWYRPGMLTPEMNRQLDETDHPFGVVVKALGFHRRTLAATLLVKPLGDGWDHGSAARPEDRPPTAGRFDADGRDFVIPDQVIQHRAILTNAAGEPFSLVVETYTDKVLPDFAP